MADDTQRIPALEPSEARTTAATESLLSEGQTLGDRYRIQKLLGTSQALRTLRRVDQLGEAVE